MRQTTPRPAYGRTTRPVPTGWRTPRGGHQTPDKTGSKKKRLAAGWSRIVPLCLSTMTLTGIQPALAGETGSMWQAAMAEANWDWRAGDLIFRSGLDPLDDQIAVAMGASFASVGVLRASSGGPRVVYVDPTDGVTEVMLFEFIEGLDDGGYSVYRLDAATVWGQADSPISYNALLVAYGQPADPYRLPGGTAYYGAELVSLAALGVGVTLGAPDRISTLADEAPNLRAAFLEGWQDHPYCGYVTTKTECWEIIDDLALLTTASIMADPSLRQVYP